MSAIYEFRPDGLYNRHPCDPGTFGAAARRDGWQDTGERVTLEGWPEQAAEVWMTADGTRFLWAPPLPFRLVA